MPSVSGWALQGPEPDTAEDPAHGDFYALGVGLGFATPEQPGKCHPGPPDVSMPSVSGGALQPSETGSRCPPAVSMPSMSGGALQRADGGEPAAGDAAGAFLCPRCRAGLCNHRPAPASSSVARCTFLCPRCRAGLCNWRRRSPTPRAATRFYALDVGRGFATARAFWDHLMISVSMPSMSGGALQQMPSEGPSDLRVCSPPRQATRKSRQNGTDRGALVPASP
jgi:hypothetical protein